MNLTHLTYFRALVEEGSFASAADRLFIARSTLSTAITSLEHELGVPLLRKKRKGISLTDEGEEFYRATLTATNAISRCVDSFKRNSEEGFSTIRVGSVYSIQNKAWSEILCAARRKAGRATKVIITQGTTETLLRDLMAGVYDVVFTGKLPHVDPEITMVPTYSQRAVLAVNKSHPLAKRNTVKLNDLVGCEVVTYRQTEGPFVDELKRLLNGYPYLKVCEEYADEITLASVAVGDPAKVSIICYNWLLDSFENLKLLEIEDAPIDFHRFYMCYRKNERKSPVFESFIRFMKDKEYGDASPVPKGQRLGKDQVTN